MGTPVNGIRCKKENVNMTLKRWLILLGATLLGAVILAACGGTPAQPTTAEPAKMELVIPFEEAFRASGHADATAEAFVHWDADGAVPTGMRQVPYLRRVPGIRFHRQGGRGHYGPGWDAELRYLPQRRPPWR